MAALSDSNQQGLKKMDGSLTMCDSVSWMELVATVISNGHKLSSEWASPVGGSGGGCWQGSAELIQSLFACCTLSREFATT